MATSLRTWLCVSILLVACKDPSRPDHRQASTSEASAQTETDMAIPAPLLEGMVSFKGEHAEFRDCINGRRFPVSTEQGFSTLKRAYSDIAASPGHPLRLTLRGRYLERPTRKAERTEVQLVIESKETLENSVCVPRTTAELRGTWWRLTWIEGGVARAESGAPEAHMVLHSASGRLRGRASCNGFSGTFRATDQSLQFEKISSTRKLCPGAMSTEQAFLSALSSADRYRISGEELELFIANTLLARFESVYH